MSIHWVMDDVEIIEYLYDAKSAQRWRERKLDGDPVEVEGSRFRVVEVFEVEAPLGAPPGTKRVWMVKAERCH